MNENIFPYEKFISKKKRITNKKYKPCIIWTTGYSGSGKSTLANALEQVLFNMEIPTYLLDGDNIRSGLNSDLSFSKKDRKENIRRVAEVAKLFLDSGIIVITAFISPFIVDRDFARSIVDKDEFIEVFVDCSIEKCEERDVKGLYHKVRNGELKEFTGITSPYEAPINNEITIDTNIDNVEIGVNKIIDYLEINNYLKQMLV